MDLRDYLSPEGVVILASEDKVGAFTELANAAARCVGSVDIQQIIDGLLTRERTLSSRISSRVAFPHLQLPGFERFLVVVGKSDRGVVWDKSGDVRVSLLVLILGDEQRRDLHLELMSGIAGVLKNDAFLQRILDAATPGEIYGLLVAPEDAVTPPGQREISRAVVAHAVNLAREVHAGTVMFHSDALTRRAAIDLIGDVRLPRHQALVLVTNRFARNEDLTGLFSDVIRVPFRANSRSQQVEMSVLFGLSRGIIGRADRVVSAFGIPGSGVVDTVIVTTVEEEFDTFLSTTDKPLTETVHQEVLERVLQICRELAMEGREGRRVGAMFVIGDFDAVSAHCNQLIINPFNGYDDDDRNILDPRLEETIKEYCMLDGAFVVRGDGVVMSAGTYLSAPPASVDVPLGLGARHTAAAAITAATDSVAVLVSESNRTIKIFKSGRIVLAID